MKTIISFLAFTFYSQMLLTAQIFIQKADIEFEVKTNIKKAMGNGSRAEMIKENLPDFKTAYYQFVFSDNKSLYKLHHFDEKTRLPDYLKKSDEANEWYVDLNNKKMKIQKNIFGSNFNIDASLPVIKWKVSNENRIIAGFNCRKAVGIIYDSVYLFAFYSDEILISGGPCSIIGLPGMILGMTIPRLYTSWIATKVNVVAINETIIKPSNSKKNYLQSSFKEILIDRTKDWSSGEENKKWQQQFLWNAML